MGVRCSVWSCPRRRRTAAVLARPAELRQVVVRCRSNFINKLQLEVNKPMSERSQEQRSEATSTPAPREAAVGAPYGAVLYEKRRGKLMPHRHAFLLGGLGE